MFHLIAKALAGLSLLALVACGGGTGGPASIPPADALSAIARSVDGPPSLTLITVINNRTGAGGHTALMINGNQRVIFDPAGSYRPDYVSVYGDVIYGISQPQFQYYRSAHARASHHVVTQTVTVAPEVAARALALVQAEGKVPSAFCARSTSEILKSLPGFGGIGVTFYPTDLRDQFASIPGVRTDEYYEDDAGKVVDGIAAAAPAE